MARVLLLSGGIHGVVVPHRASDNRLLERCGEIECVTRGRTAEGSGAGFAGDGMVSSNPDGVAVLRARGIVRLFIDHVGVRAAPWIEQQACGTAGRKSEPGDAGAVG